MDPQLEMLAKITHVPEECQLQDAAISLGLQFDFCIYVHQQLFWVPVDMEHIGYMLCKIPSGWLTWVLFFLLQERSKYNELLQARGVVPW